MRVNLVCVQQKLDIMDYSSPASFYSRLQGYLQKVAAVAEPGCSTLVAFPEDTGTPLIFSGYGHLLGSEQSLAAAVQRLIRARFMPVVAWKLLRRTGWSQAIALERAGFLRKHYIDVFSRLAREFGYYIVGGSILLPDSGTRSADIYNVSYLFGPDGNIIGSQKKVNLIELEGEQGLGLAGGELGELAVYDTEIGRIGIAICFDAFHETVLDKLRQQGTDILVQPSANPGPWHHDQRFDWVKSAATACGEKGWFPFALNPMMTGTLFDLVFEGQSAIFSASGSGEDRASGLGYAATGPLPGCVAVAPSWVEEEVIVATVDI
ncbi:MAG: carbon-nitrogen hydrolase family protein [Firmicutes bacterium]|nr:carbon-nitrogen hydrolase family protein [Bacillota bacterium]